MASRALKNSGCPDNAELSILLTDNNGIRRLNKQYRKKDMPTDVLSFPMMGGRKWEARGGKRNIPHPISYLPHPVILGDVVISVETAKTQAKESSATVQDEIKKLLIHGILHLLGYNHEKGGSEARKMKKEEERLLGR